MKWVMTLVGLCGWLAVVWPWGPRRHPATPDLFLDEPVYRLKILASFLDPWWYARVVTVSAGFTALFILAAVTGWHWGLAKPTDIGAVFGLVATTWLGALLIFPLSLSLIVRPLIYLQGPLVRLFMRRDDDEMFRWFGMFTDVMIWAAVNCNIVYASMVALGMASL